MMKNSKHSLFNSGFAARVAGGAGVVRPAVVAKVNRAEQIDAMFAKLHSSEDFTLAGALKDYAALIKVAGR